MLNIYRKILNQINLTTKDDEFGEEGVYCGISHKFIEINNTRIYLPTQNNIKSTNNLLLFNPLYEILTSKNDVIQFLISHINKLLNYNLIYNYILLDDRFDRIDKNKVTNEDLDILKNIKDKPSSLDHKTVVKVIRDIKFIDIFVKKSVTENDINFYRGAYVTFPVLTHKYTQTVAQKEYLLSMAKYLLGGKAPETYNSFSNKEYPTLDVLINSYNKLVDGINDQLIDLKKIENDIVLLTPIKVDITKEILKQANKISNVNTHPANNSLKSDNNDIKKQPENKKEGNKMNNKSEVTSAETYSDGTPFKFDENNKLIPEEKVNGIESDNIKKWPDGSPMLYTSNGKLVNSSSYTWNNNVINANGVNQNNKKVINLANLNTGFNNRGNNNFNIQQPPQVQRPIVTVPLSVRNGSASLYYIRNTNAHPVEFCPVTGKITNFSGEPIYWLATDNRGATNAVIANINSFGQIDEPNVNYQNNNINRGGNAFNFNNQGGIGNNANNQQSIVDELYRRLTASGGNMNFANNQVSNQNDFGLVGNNPNINNNSFDQSLF